MNRNIFFAVLFLCYVLIGCKQKYLKDEEIYIPIDKSRLYVRLLGNTNGPVIINLHGGPGGFSGFDHEFNRKYLEKEYLIAYLDQRGCGKSDFEKDASKLNMNQAVEDLNVVVDSIKKRFPTQKINLLGGSWGGTLGLLYMIKHQDKINSFVCASGKADGIYPVKALIEYEKRLASEKIQSMGHPDSAKVYEEIISKLNEITESNWDSLYNEMTLIKHTYPKLLGFNAYWNNKEALEKVKKLANDSGYYKRAKYTKKQFDDALAKGEYVNRIFRSDSAYNNLNILGDLKVIHKPVMVIQGDQDFAIGIKQGQMIYDALLGLQNKEKKIYLLHNAAHNLNVESEKEYYSYVRQFLEIYNLNATE